jgi:hypothetical protein
MIDIPTACGYVVIVGLTVVFVMGVVWAVIKLIKNLL